MKTLKCIKGSLVLVHTERGQLLFRCWPYDSLDSSSILLPFPKFFQDYVKGHAYCNCYNLTLHSSDLVLLECDNPKPFMETYSFKKFMKAQLGNV